MHQRSHQVKKPLRISGRGPLLAVLMGVVLLAAACGRPDTAVVPTVTRIPDAANAPVVATTAPTEAPAEPTTAPTEPETASPVAETGSPVTGAATAEAAGSAVPEAATTEAATPAEETGGASTESGDYAGLTGDVSKGKQLSAQCIACHSIDGSTIVGPTWKGLYGHEVTLEDGSTVTADSDYIAESIRDPNAKIVQGFPPVMPPFAYLSDQDIADLIAYIKTLE